MCPTRPHSTCIFPLYTYLPNIYLWFLLILPIFQLTLLLPNIQTCQTCLHLRIFALAAPFAWKPLFLKIFAAFPTHFLQVFTEMPPLQKGLPRTLSKMSTFHPQYSLFPHFIYFFSPFQLSPSKTLCILLLCHCTTSLEYKPLES